MDTLPEAPSPGHRLCPPSPSSQTQPPGAHSDLRANQGLPGRRGSPQGLGTRNPQPQQLQCDSVSLTFIQHTAPSCLQQAFSGHELHSMNGPVSLEEGLAQGPAAGCWGAPHPFHYSPCNGQACISPAVRGKPGSCRVGAVPRDQPFSTELDVQDPPHWDLAPNKCSLASHMLRAPQPVTRLSELPTRL